MSDDDWLGGDPFANPDDPAAREREQRRLEREEKRRKREEKRGKKGAAKEAPPLRPAPAADRSPATQVPPERAQPTSTPPPVPSEPAPSSESAQPSPAAEAPPSSRSGPSTTVPPPPEPPSAAEPPRLPRTPEQEFWDEDPSAEEELPADDAPAADSAAAAWHEPREQAWDVPDEGLSPEQTPDARDPGRSGSGGGRSGGSRLGAVGRHPFRLIGVIAAILVLWFLFALFQPFHGDGSGKVAVTIPKGASVSEVGDLLGEKGVIDSSTLFQVRVTLDGKRSDLFPGHYVLAHGMSYSGAIDALTTPRERPTTTTVTIPEGYARSQAAPLVAEDGLKGSYMKETVKSKYLNPAKYGGKGAKNLEGFLFPDTFELKPGSPVANLVQLQLQDFQRRIKGVNMSYAKSKNLTVFDVLTIASMVEREAGVASQRKLVASVIYNRLHEGMPLGIDATIRFATGNYEEPLTESQLAVDSPYNTRTNAGLPPGPINSPGLAAIEAAAHPAKTGYLFYVNNPKTCDELTFAKTEAEFEADVEKYNSARAANGGNEPSTCGE
jgi:peptidoglycan lytic transglycosylase G